MKQLAMPCLILAAATLLGACGLTPPGNPGKTRPVTILSHVDGSDTGFSDAGVQLINSADELQARGSGMLNAVAVDFRDQSMIVLALGEQPTTGWAARITGVQRAGNAIYVQGTAYSPGENDVVGQSLTYPVAAVIVPKLRAEMIHPEISDAEAAPGDGM